MFLLTYLFTVLQWQVTGGLGYHGAHAVKPVVRVRSPESVCATTLLQHSMDRSVRAQTPKHKCARRDLVQVRTPGFYSPFKFDSYSFKVTDAPASSFFVSSSGWKVVILGELGSLQCFMWRRDQTAKAPLCQPRPPKWWQAV